MKKNLHTVSIIGLGYVGLPLAIELGKVYNVTGFDINKDRIKELKLHKDSTREVDYKTLESINIDFTYNISDIKNQDFYIVTVPTPVDGTDSPDLNPLKSASEIVGKSIKDKSIVIYESTVYPGCTEEVCVPLIEKNSGMKFNVDFFVGYSPERINPADKQNTIRTIKKIVSASNEDTLEKINHLYSKIIDAGTHKVSSIKVAEAAKVIENTQRDLNISLMNELSIILNRIDVDTLEVLEAAETKWNFLPFRPGLVGGHCIGVDPYYLTHKARMMNYDPEVILSGRKINDSMTSYIFDKLLTEINNEGKNTSMRIGYFGLTFKENCPDIRNSKSLELFRMISATNNEILVNDPYISEKDAKTYKINITKFEDMQKLDVAVFAVGHSCYRELPFEALNNIFGKTKILFDIKSIFDKKSCHKAGMKVFRL